MKIKDIISALNQISVVGEDTKDTVQCGNEENDVQKIAVSMFATVDTIRNVSKWGADFLIVHEPLYYHDDAHAIQSPVVTAKKELIANTGLTIFRFHDHMHTHFPDLITKGEMTYAGLEGELKKTEYFASYLFIPKEQKTGREILNQLNSNLGLKHIRVCGELDKPIKKAALCFGTPGGVFELLRDETVDAVFTGETSEWSLCEYARDASQLGINKSIFIMGHCGSERDGMRLLADHLQTKYPELQVKYFECGEVFSDASCES